MTDNVKHKHKIKTASQQSNMLPHDYIVNFMDLVYGLGTLSALFKLLQLGESCSSSMCHMFGMGEWVNASRIC